MLDQSSANQPVELTDELVTKLKRLPDIELARVAKQLVVDDRTAVYLQNAIDDYHNPLKTETTPSQPKNPPKFR